MATSAASPDAAGKASLGSENSWKLSGQLEPLESVMTGASPTVKDTGSDSVICLDKNLGHSQKVHFGHLTQPALKLSLKTLKVSFGLPFKQEKSDVCIMSFL